MYMYIHMHIGSYLLAEIPELGYGVLVTHLHPEVCACMCTYACMCVCTCVCVYCVRVCMYA